MALSCDSKLIPILITLFEIFGSLFESEIKIVSRYFSSSPDDEWVIGPIIILAPLLIISFIARFN